MKTRIMLLIVVLLAMWQGAVAQPDLQIVWQKDIFPTQISFAKWSAEGNFIYCAVGNNIHKMDAKTGEFVSAFDNTESNHGIYGMDISSLGNYILTENSEGGAIIWDTKMENILKKISPDSVPKPGYSGFEGASISPDEKYVLIGQIASIWEGGLQYTHYHLLIYNIQVGKEIYRIELTDRISKITFSQDGKKFAIGSYYKDNFSGKYFNKLVIRETGTWKELVVLEDKEDEDNSPGYRLLKFSFDDKYLGVITQNINGPFIYDLNTNQLTKTTDGKACVAIEFLPDSLHYITVIAVDGFGLYELSTHKLIKLYNVEEYGGGLLESSNMIDGNYFIFSMGSLGGDGITLIRGIITDIQENENNNWLKISVESSSIIILSNYSTDIIFDITISDLLGKLIYNDHIRSRPGVNKCIIKTLIPSGFYICKVKAGNKEYSQKIEIVR